MILLQVGTIVGFEHVRVLLPSAPLLVRREQSSDVHTNYNKTINSRQLDVLTNGRGEINDSKKNGQCTSDFTHRFP